MASLKEMRNRIASVKATQKITKAMQMVAAAKLRRSQDAATGARPYAQRMATVIANLAAGVSGDAAPPMLAGTGDDKRHLVIVAASDRGLAGGFNGNVVRAARDHINELIAAGKTVSIVTVGKKTIPVLRRLYGDRIVASFDSGAKPSLDAALAIAHDATARGHPHALRGAAAARHAQPDAHPHAEGRPARGAAARAGVEDRGA